MKITIGLDIGSQAIKLVKLKLDKDKAELGSFSMEPNAAGALEEALKRITQEQEPKKCAISFSGLSTVTRYVSFPKMTAAELKQALKFEAQKHIPFALNEVNLDAVIIKDDLPENKMLVLLAAAKKDIITGRLKAVEAAGLKATLIDIDSLALLNAFTFNNSLDIVPKYKVIALLNVGSEASSLNIIEAGIPRFSRDIHIAGHNFTQKISDILGLDFAAAEKLKINPDKEANDKIKTAIEPVFTNLAGEIRNSFDYYESQGTASVERIFLSGGGAKSFGFKEMLSAALGIEAECWDPFKKISLPSGIDSVKLKETASQLAVAVGLALRQ